MSRLYINTPNTAQVVVEGLYKDMERRIISSPPGICPIDISLSFLSLCHAQTCGKCVPCRIGLGKLKELMEKVLSSEADESTIDLIEETSRVIMETADCAIGTEAAEMVLKGVMGLAIVLWTGIYLYHALAYAQQVLTYQAIWPW